jgi:hypothetical protein
LPLRENVGHDLPLIEASPYYLFCIRPRRFGKTLWLTLLDYYYDVNEKENFDALFGDTYIGQHPTADRNAYLTLTSDSLTVLRISLNWKGEPKQADELTKEKTEPAQGE